MGGLDNLLGESFEEFKALNNSIEHALFFIF